MEHGRNQGGRHEPRKHGGATVAEGCEAPLAAQHSADTRELRPSYWDLDELLERLDGDQEFLRELLAIFLQDAPGNCAKSREALAAQNFPELTRAAHTLKGMLKNLAMKAAAQTAASLEDAARKELPAESQEYLRQLERDFQEIFPRVHARLAEVKS